MAKKPQTFSQESNNPNRDDNEGRPVPATGENGGATPYQKSGPRHAPGPTGLFSQEQLRQIAWDIGGRYPLPLTSDYIALCWVHPRSGQTHWHVSAETVAAARAGGDGFEHAALVVRIYDITEIIFDGYNAHAFFDIGIGDLSGNYYFSAPRLDRNYMAEIGLRAGDGRFKALARSNSRYFDRDRPAGNYQVGGMFVGRRGQRKFPVENVFDAPVYERLNQALVGDDRPAALAVALVYLSLDPAAGLDTPLGQMIQKFARRLDQVGGQAQLFASVLIDTEGQAGTLPERVAAHSKKISQALVAAHKKTPFDLIHCHDWYSAAVGLTAARALGRPLVLSLHSTEHERTQGNLAHPVAAAIARQEAEAVQQAALVIVPHSATRQQVISLYGAPAEKVVIIPDVFDDQRAGHKFDPNAQKLQLGLSPDTPIVLFAGEISHAAGADLLLDAIPTVCRNRPGVQFVFVGEGPLKGELQARAHHSGFGDRIRFFGDVDAETFDILLLACDFVVIPARTWQGEGLAQAAIERGRSVLTTHQAGITCVVHGQNGLVTYDNPGSIVWGVQELLSNPLQGSMLRLVARREASESPSLETAAAQHYLYYTTVLNDATAGRS